MTATEYHVDMDAKSSDEKDDRRLHASEDKTERILAQPNESLEGVLSDKESIIAGTLEEAERASNVEEDDSLALVCSSTLLAQFSALVWSLVGNNHSNQVDCYQL
jgi:hypothetical protein